MSERYTYEEGVMWVVESKHGKDGWVADYSYAYKCDAEDKARKIQAAYNGVQRERRVVRYERKLSKEGGR